MTATPYKPVSFGSESLELSKLQQMASNDQWLFENSTKVRYRSGDLIRDGGGKIIAGKTPYAAQSNNYLYLPVYFGSFFSVGCKPVVTITNEPGVGGHRNKVVIVGFSNGQEIDQRGFTAVISTEAVATIGASGFLHWIAAGY